MMKKIGSLLKPGPLNIVAAEWEQEPGGESHKARCENLRGKQLSRSTKYIGRIKNPGGSNGNSYEIRWSRYCAHRCKTGTHNCGGGCWGARVTRNDSWRADVRVTWSSWAELGARPFRLRPVGNTNFSEVTSLAQKKQAKSFVCWLYVCYFTWLELKSSCFGLSHISN